MNRGRQATANAIRQCAECLSLFDQSIKRDEVNAIDAAAGGV
jgi:hypothetical protein